MSKEFSGEDTAKFSSDMVAGQPPTLTPEESAALAALPASSALLIIHRGPGAGSRYLLDQNQTVAGRHPDADIFLDDVTVSRRHASFDRAGNIFTVSDLGSMNGTYADSKRVDKQRLINGMEIMIGKFRLTFYSSDKDR
jgi:pSer/pThr/pTyr-binding forkhead associated (FHA) protein